jgi:hypothetical protein
MREINNQEKVMNIKTRNELIFELNKFKNNIGKPTYDYMMSLINLETSALEVPQDTLDLLLFKNTSLFIDIVSYNIYQYTYNYFLNDSNLRIDDQSNNIKIYLDKYKLYDFYQDYSYDNLRFGEVNFYNVVYDPEYNDYLDEKLSKELDEEYKKSFSSYKDNINNYKNHEKIEKLKKEIEHLRDHIIPNDEEKRLIEDYERYNESLMNHFRIEQSGFNVAKDYGDIKKRSFLKKTNNVKVYKNIRYI